MKEIKKVDIISVAKIFGLLFGGFYLATGLVVNISVLIFKVPLIAKFDILGFGSGALATFFVALLVGGANFTLGVILGWLYNLTAKIVGGVRIKLEDVSEDSAILKNTKSPGITYQKSLINSSQPQQEINHLLKSDQLLPNQVNQTSEKNRDTFTAEG